jgi:hypothetical protein
LSQPSERRTCGAVHPETGYVCGLDPHSDGARHSVNVGYGWLTWREGTPDKVHHRASRQENNERSEREDTAAYEWGRGRERDDLFWWQR